MQQSKIAMMCLVLVGAMGLAACGSDGNKGGLEGAAVAPNDNGVVVEPGGPGGEDKGDPSQPVVPPDGGGEGGATVTEPGDGDADKPAEPGSGTGGDAGGNTAGGDAGSSSSSGDVIEYDKGGAILDAISTMGNDAQRTRLEYLVDACDSNAACVAQVEKLTDYLKDLCPTSAGCTNPVASSLLYGKEPSASSRNAGLCPVGDCARIEDIKDVVYTVFDIDPANDAGSNDGNVGSPGSPSGDEKTQPGGDAGSGAAGGDRGGSAGGGTSPGAGGSTGGSGDAGSGSAPAKP